MHCTFIVTMWMCNSICISICTSWATHICTTGHVTRLMSYINNKMTDTRQLPLPSKAPSNIQRRPKYDSLLFNVTPDRGMKYNVFIYYWERNSNGIVTFFKAKKKNIEHLISPSTVVQYLAVKRHGRRIIYMYTYMCFCICTYIVTNMTTGRQRFGKHVPAATNTRRNNPLLGNGSRKTRSLCNERMR
jgi:hypothetical protein